MELLKGRGRPLRFAVRRFTALRREYEALADAGEATEWTSIAELRNVAGDTRPTAEGHLLGHISARSALDWLGWERGGLYAVLYDGDVLFCTARGTVVVGLPPEGERWSC